MDVNPQDDVQSADADPIAGSDESVGDQGYDLTPRTSAGDSKGSTGTRKYVAIGAVVLVVAALGFVLFKGLDDAATFFYNVDEALEQQDDLTGERFRMQGSVAEGSVSESSEGVNFTITFAGESTPVSHTGTPPELFGPDIPVVVEGTFTSDGTFVSDEILIKHDSSYDEEYPERIREAEDSGSS